MDTRRVNAVRPRLLQDLDCAWVRWTITAAIVGFATMSSVPHAQAADSLHSWNSGPTKAAIVQFVKDVTTEGGPQYVPPAERIAIFSNDGTLCPEQPMPVQLAFALDRIKALASKHPQWKRKEPFKSALSRNLKSLAASGTRGILELMTALHAGITPEEFEKSVHDWMMKARHQKLNRRYSQCSYLPMLEVLAYLRASGFRTYVLAGGSVEFMRPWAERLYGIPRDQVIGSGVKLKFEMRKGVPLLVGRPEFDFLDDMGGKPAGIYRFIGRRPIAAFGNADTDLGMLEWVEAGSARHFTLLVRHTDGENEYAYDRKATFGKLDKALDVAKRKGWTIADMTKDWNRVFSKETK